MYGEVVDGVDGHLFEEALSKLKERARRRRSTSTCPPRTWPSWSRPSRASTRARRAAGSRRTRASSCHAPCARSSTPGTTRARRSTAGRTTSRTTSARPSTSSRWSSATRATQSGTGVAFTRDPSTGEPGLYGEFLANAQGEDVVAGIRTPEPLDAHAARRCRRRSSSSSATMQRLEEHYRDMQDIEFTVEDGRLYLLQTRSAKRTAAAALKSAVDMVDEGLISREEAVARIDPGQLDQLLHPMIDPARERRGRRAGAERLAGRRLGEDRVRRRHRGRAREERRQRDPRPLGDDAGRHPRDDRGAGDPDRARRHDLARGGRRARDGQAVRRRLRSAHGRHGGEDCGARRPRARRGRRDHDRRRHGPRDRSARSSSSRRRSTRTSRRSSAGPTTCGA